MDVALVTGSEWPDLSQSDTILQKALLARGIDAQPLIWNDPAVDWSCPLVSIIRSTWDSHLHRTAFLEWAQHVSQGGILWNPLPLLQWNTHKGYLRDLEEHGIPTIPTKHCMQGSSVALARLMQEQHWSEVVIKPAVSAEAYGTILIKEGMLDEGQFYLDHMVSLQDMLIQPFLPTILSSGEQSLMFIDGEFTHAVVRPPIHAVSREAASDKSMQKQSGVSEERIIVPQEEEVRLGYRILETLSSPTLYARVDLVHDVNGKPCVMEVELVEPGLWLAWAPDAAERFADAIAREVLQARNKRA
ncbi:ATP-grasp domain-containing protein [Reticulibacter mediterranei]|uniref:ATP-grasp domain-containing protein n=1 Tax=Reticulibacter mediterranei TaxID=2778369 RepID=A0A8J3J2J2_9CHLR|nr:hypothetical protein [Reticulibacter mediterranei]GHP01158.1 ATP-grasp domain-containing protein [Reticulibacter mediterranei]